MNNLKIGDFVVSTNEELPLRSTYQWYPRAVVVAIEPNLVLVSEDCTKIWLNANAANYAVEKLISDELMQMLKEEGKNTAVYQQREIERRENIAKQCNLRYLNDRDGIAYDAIKETRAHVVNATECVIDNDARSVKDTFELLKQFLYEERGVWRAAKPYIITVDSLEVSEFAIYLGSLSIKTIGVNQSSRATYLQLTTLFTNTVRVCAPIYAINA